MSNTSGARVPLARASARPREGAAVGLAAADALPVHEAQLPSAGDRQRDLFPLPLHGAGPPLSQSSSPPSRSVRRRLERRSHIDGMVYEMADTLNDLWGCPAAGRGQVPSCSSAPSAGHAQVFKELREAALRFGPCPDGLDGPGALEELRISQSCEGHAAMVAPVNFDVVDPAPLP